LQFSGRGEHLHSWAKQVIPRRTPLVCWCSALFQI